MRTIRASELGTFLYCRRAWWYQLQGEISSNQAQLEAGTKAHQYHARKVKLIPVLLITALVLVIIAVILLAVKS